MLLCNLVTLYNIGTKYVISSFCARDLLAQIFWGYASTTVSVCSTPSIALIVSDNLRNVS